ncbi:hypothetical protein Tco_0527796 [Tanacetum coccineum]
MTVNQEVEGDQVKDVDQATVTDAPTKVQHEDPSSQTLPLLTVPVLVIPESSIALATTIPPPIPPFIPLPQQLTPIPTPTTTTISTTSAPDYSTLTTIHQRLSNLEKEVKTHRNVDHSSTIHAAINSEVLTVVKEYLGTSLDDTLHKVIQRHTAKLIKEHSIPADVVEVPQHHLTKNTKHKALCHALMESILEDEDAMDKGVVDKLKKRKLDDADRDEGPPAGPDQGLKRKKMGKDTKPPKKAKSTGISKGTTKSQPKSTDKSAQAEETVFKDGDTQVPQDLGEDIGNTDEPPVVKAEPKNWFKKLERPPTPDPEWSECKTVDSKPTQK